MKLAQVSVSVLAALAMAFCSGTAGAQRKPVHATQAAKARQTARSKPASGTSHAGKKFEIAGKRDPFVSLIHISKGGGRRLPPGEAGLVIATVRVEGTVKSPGGMIAVLSNPQQHVYFVHDGDHLYDGNVEKITLTGVTFLEKSKDAFGRPIERTVTKRIYATAGEQQ